MALHCSALGAAAAAQQREGVRAFGGKSKWRVLLADNNTLEIIAAWTKHDWSSSYHHVLYSWKLAAGACGGMQLGDIRVQTRLQGRNYEH